MNDFWFLCALLSLVAASFLLYPAILSVLRKGAEHQDASAGQLERQKENVSLFKKRLAELDKELSSADISETEYAAFKEELERNLLADSERISGYGHTRGGGVWLIVVAMAAIPLLSFALYQQLGAKGDVEIKQLLDEIYQTDTSSEPENSAAAQAYQDKISDVVGLMESRLAIHPDKHHYSILLGQIYSQRQDYLNAAEQYHRLSEQMPGDADAHAFYAQALYLANGRQLSAAVEASMNAALAIHPAHPTVLGLKGIHYFEAQDYTKAIASWQRLLASIDPASAQSSMIQRGIEEARKRGGLSLADSDASESSLASVKVSVTLPADLQQHEGIGPQTVVFVLAKAVKGPPMPLAIQRMTVADFPAVVTLDDSSAMMPAMRLSNFEEIEVLVRVSPSGGAKSQPGDWQARSGVLRPEGGQIEVALSPDQRL
jgi:cytochrome c-type biogenesis protein CcmH